MALVTTTMSLPLDIEELRILIYVTNNRKMVLGIFVCELSVAESIIWGVFYSVYLLNWRAIELNIWLKFYDSKSPPFPTTLIVSLNNISLVDISSILVSQSCGLHNDTIIMLSSLYSYSPIHSIYSQHSVKVPRGNMI